MDDSRRRHVEMTQDPSLPRLFARAAATARGRSGDLPEAELVRRGVRVDVDSLSRYSQVCGYDLSGRLPSTYLHVLTFGLQMALMTDRAFPLALPGMVHLSNANVLRRPVEVGETLDLSVHAEALRPHHKGAQFDLVGRVDVPAATGDAETVWTGRSTYLSPGARAPATDSADPGDGDGGGDTGDTGVGTLEPVGVPFLPAATWRVAADTGRRYAAVSGDVNPIHLNPLAAKAFGFPRAIAHGMWTYARTLAWIGARASGPGTSTVEFSRPVALPSTVDVHSAHRDDAWTVELRPGGSRRGETGRDGRPRRHLVVVVRPG